MSGKLPSDFDARRYLASYPDVAMSGLDPATHYLRFGRLMGRSPNGRAAAPKTATEEAPPAKPSKPAEILARPNERPAAVKSAPIIERPSDFRPADVIPMPAPAKGTADAAGNVNLETLALGPFASAEDREQLCSPLVAYALMMAMEPPAGLSLTNMSGLCGARVFERGETRVENAWFAESPRLRLMIAGGSDPASASKGWALRAYQAHPAAPDKLKAAGPGIQLPALGPVFHDMELIHPLMPLLLELSDADGVTRGIALLPFPSLLPGGIHGVELKALQADPNPMDAFWSLSEILLRELLGTSESPARSITKLSRHGDVQETAQSLSPDLAEWLSALFGLSVEPAEKPAPVARKSKRANGGLNLVLPANSVPTISALVSRRLIVGNEAVAPFLVAELPGLRPRWSVTLPVGQEPVSSIPVVRGTNASPAEASPQSIPIHVAIAQRPADKREDTDLAPERAALPPQPLPLTVVLEASDPGRTEAVVRAIQENTGDDFELLVHITDGDDALRGVLDRLSGPAGWKATGDAELSQLARGAKHDILLTVSDRASLDSQNILSSLHARLAGDDAVASVACLLLAEKRIKKETVLQPATGGLFPAGVSFASAPRLTFFEPDVLQALPNLTYDVVANTFLLTLWRTSALAALPDPIAPVPESAKDIRLGLDLTAAGFRNLCTTQVSADLVGTYARRDAIDPLGSAYLQPRDWEAILDKVTVIRELF